MADLCSLYCWGKIHIGEKREKHLKLNSMLPFDRQLSNLWPKLLTQYHICYFELLLFYKFVMEKKNSAGCLLKTKWLMKKLNKMQIFTSHFDFRRLNFISPKNLPNQSNKYETTKTLGFVQVWMPFDRKISNLWPKLLSEWGQRWGFYSLLHSSMAIVLGSAKVLNSTTENEGKWRKNI